MTECCGRTDTPPLLARSGGSNVAQIGNEAAKALDQLGIGRRYCAMGVAGRLPGFVEIALDAGRRVAIEGGEAERRRNGLDAAGALLDTQLVVSRPGIAKGHHLDIARDEEALAAGAVSAASGGGSCCWGDEGAGA